jgi:two-component system, LytTR family, sensor kinase
MAANRRIVWLQLLIGWLPLWALFAAIIHAAHHTSLAGASHIALRMILAAAALGFLVLKFAERFAWPSPVTPGFVATHFAAALLYSASWIALNSLIESAIRGRLVLVVGVGVLSSFMLGIWLYVMIAGVSYTSLATERAAKAEAAAAKAQLAALRSQLHPHFLFNALHTVVHLIPREPARAADAAEKLAGLLRTAVEEERDLVTVAEEFAFVSQYLDIERIRFGDRLRVEDRLAEGTRDALIPAFSLQTLVENAVRHAVAPRVDATAVNIDTRFKDGMLEVVVRDTGGGNVPESTNGTGLKRLRERLDVLYSGRSTLDVRSNGDGVVATMRIPQDD